MKEVFILQCTIFLLVAAGCFLKRKGIVTREGQKCITDLVIDVVLPCNIVKAFCMDFSAGMGAELIATLLIAIAIQAFAVVYGKVVFRREPDGRSRCLRYGTICSNGGFLGNPVAEGIYGPYGLLLASIFLIPVRIMMWTEGVSIYSGIRDAKTALKTAVTHPCIVACGIGIALMLTGFRFPAPVQNTISYLGACNTALSMLIIGMILGDMKLQTFLDKTAWIYCLHRLVLLPGLCFVILLLLPVSSTVRGLAVILTAMPAGATTSILAAQNNMEPEFATKLVVCSTLLSLPTLALWTMIV